LCEDTNIIGAIFYVMERRRGIVIRTDEPAQLSDNPAARRDVSKAMVDALAQLHLVDIYQNKLETLGKPNDSSNAKCAAGQNAGTARKQAN
jgi:aminoglycoside phosphotransferase (APT) family kinase protein